MRSSLKNSHNKSTHEALHVTRTLNENAFICVLYYWNLINFCLYSSGIRGGIKGMLNQSTFLIGSKMSTEQ